MNNNYIVILIFICITIFQTKANNDKYRLTIASDPSTTITIGWNQISGSNPQVYYGTTDHGTNYTLYNNVKAVDRSVSFRGMDNRFARLTGLAPNTNYYFVIHDSQGTSQRFWFKTAPDDLSRLSFIAGGDSRNNRTPRQKANLLVSKLKPHGVFFGGDMTDDDTSAEWQDWFDDWQLTISSDGRMIPIVAARGNHEYDASAVYNLFDTPTQDSYYAITFGDNLIRTYTLNSEISVLGNQLTWLQNDLNSTAGTDAKWKMAQYHKPMRPHTSGKSEGNSEYNAWAQLFYDKGVNLVVDCDSHMAKTTYPIKPSNGPNSDEGFEIDNQFGTVYTGEGTWGAPLRPNDDDKSWTRSSGSFNQFKLIFIDENKIELRTIQVDNADIVGENPNNDPFQLPNNLDVFSPPTGAVVTILSNTNNCPAAGTACDDGDPNTVSDEEDGFCNCTGVPQNGTLDILVADDAEEGETGSVYLDSSDIELVFDSFDNQNNQTVGLRFANIPLPDNAIINSAYIQFTADESNSETTSLIIKGEDSGDSAFFTNSSNNITNRNLTSAQVSWNNIPGWSTGDSGINQRTPDLSSILSEVLLNSSWTLNNAITFIISGSGVRVAESTEGSSTNAARLNINYSIPIQTSCNSPSNFSVTNIDTNSVDLSWNTVNEAGNGYEWVVMADGVSPSLSNASASGTTLNTSVQVTGISENMSYDAYVLSNCGSGDLSGWSNKLDFTTLENPCDVPLNFSASNISTDSVDLSWDMVIQASVGYEWVIMQDGQLPDSTSALFSGLTSDLVVQVVGLSNLTTYDAYVRSDCGSGNTSEWSTAVEFTVNTCPLEGTACNDGNPNTINDIEDGFCNCSGVLPGGSLDLLVTEDAEEGESGAIYTDSSDVELIFDSFDNQNNQTVGLRFTNISIPVDASITNAYIQFTTDEASSGTTNLVINGEYSGNASSFSTSINNITSRNLTSTAVAVDWNNVPAWNSVGESGAEQRTPNISNIVQEIMTHPNWSSTNAMVFIITGTGARTAESLEGSTNDAARLIIDYTLTPVETCDIPLNLSTSNISTDSVDLNWNTVSQANVVYEWVLMEAGTLPNVTNSQFTGTSSNEFVQVTGLADNTSYDVYVRSNCENNNVSGWSNLVQFTTDIICNAPTDLTANNLTQSSVELSWNSVIGAVNGYDWMLMADGMLPDSSTALFSGSTLDLTVQITDLSNITTYDAYVRSDCGSENNSNWTVALKFTTVDECDPITSGNIDSDGDSVADICDIDDDNDGILDVDEINN